MKVSRRRMIGVTIALMMLATVPGNALAGAFVERGDTAFAWLHACTGEVLPIDGTTSTVSHQAPGADPTHHVLIRKTVGVATSLVTGTRYRLTSVLTQTIHILPGESSVTAVHRAGIVHVAGPGSTENYLAHTTFIVIVVDGQLKAIHDDTNTFTCSR